MWPNQVCSKRTAIRVCMLMVLLMGINRKRLLAQERADRQFWQDVVLDYQLGKNLLETEMSYQTLLAKENKWYSLNISPAYERSINKYFDLISALPLSYTVQTDTSNSFEVRAMIGGRVYFTPGKRIETRFTYRFEYRFFHDVSMSEWVKSTRSRFRAEVIVPINRPNYYSDKMLYCLGDIEVFSTVDKEVEERYANRFRMRLGGGYRLSYNWRFEAIYMLQQSRNNVEDGYNSVDNILRLRVKCYFPFRKKKVMNTPGPEGGSGY